jgi:hypothetical protein
MNKHIAPHVRPYVTNPFSLAFRAFEKGLKINQNPVITLLVGGFILGIFQQIPNVFGQSGELLFNENSSDTALAFVFLLIIFSIIVVASAVQLIWTAFSMYVGYKNGRDEQVAVVPALEYAATLFWKMLGLQWLIGLRVILWLLPSGALFVIAAVLLEPARTLSMALFTIAGLALLIGVFFGIRLQLACSLSMYVIYDLKLGIVASMRRSEELTRHRLIEVLGVSFAAAIIPFISHALTPLSGGEYYEQLKTYRDNKVALPEVHILSWLSIMILGGIILLIAMIAIPIAVMAILNK